MGSGQPFCMPGSLPHPWGEHWPGDTCWLQRAAIETLEIPFPRVWACLWLYLLKQSLFWQLHVPQPTPR